MENKREILVESASYRIVISALVSTVREMFLSLVHDAKQADKRALGIAKKSLDKFYKEFDSKKINDNVFYDSLVEKFQDHASDMLGSKTSYQDRREVFSTFVAVVDYCIFTNIEKFVFTDKYIMYHVSLINRPLTRHFCNVKNPSEDLLNRTAELLGHTEERVAEIKKILIENLEHEVPEVSEESQS